MCRRYTGMLARHTFISDSEGVQNGSCTQAECVQPHGTVTREGLPCRCREKSAAQEAAAAVRGYLLPGGGGGCIDREHAAASSAAADASPSHTELQTTFRQSHTPELVAGAVSNGPPPTLVEPAASASASAAAPAAAVAAADAQKDAAAATDCDAGLMQPGAAAEQRDRDCKGGDGGGGGCGKTAFSVVKLGASGLTLLQAPGASWLAMHSALNQLRPCPLICVHASRHAQRTESASSAGFCTMHVRGLAVFLQVCCQAKRRRLSARC